MQLLDLLSFHLCLVVLHSGKTPALDFSFHSFPLNLALKLCAAEVIVRSPACLRVLLYIQRPSLCFLEPQTVSPCAKAPASATPWFSCPRVLLGFCFDCFLRLLLPFLESAESVMTVAFRGQGFLVT